MIAALHFSTLKFTEVHQSVNAHFHGNSIRCFFSILKILSTRHSFPAAAWVGMVGFSGKNAAGTRP